MKLSTEVALLKEQTENSERKNALDLANALKDFKEQLRESEKKTEKMKAASEEKEKHLKEDMKMLERTVKQQDQSIEDKNYNKQRRITFTRVLGKT